MKSRDALLDIAALTGAGTSYPYSEVHRLPAADVRRWIDRIRRLSANRAKQWNSVIHSQYLARYYIALRFIVAATVMLASEEYATARNLRIVQPYLRYYALLTMLRAFECTVPSIEWQDNEIPKRDHTGYINIAVNELASINPEIAGTVAKIVWSSKQYRNMLSYAFPLSGLRIASELNLPTHHQIIKICVLLAELAEINSECMYTACRKFTVGPFAVDEHTIRQCYEYHATRGVVFDDDDWYRAPKMEAIQFLPPLYFIPSDGWIDDVLAAWDADDDNDENVFSLGSSLYMLFPFGA